MIIKKIIKFLRKIFKKEIKKDVVRHAEENIYVVITQREEK